MSMHPALGAFGDLLEPLTAAEQHVAEALATLEPGWTVYVKPRLGLDRPDFVALHDVHGVCSIEVVDWTLDSVARDGVGRTHSVTPATPGHDPDARSDDSPRFSACRTRGLVFDQFYALPEHGGTPTAAVRAVVVVPGLDTATARRFLPPTGSNESDSLIGVFGGDAVDASIRDIVVGLGCPVPPAASMSKLRRHIVASERTDIGSGGAWMSPQVREVALNPSGGVNRRVRGPAGSGKSFAVTARAAQLAAAGRSVLVLSLNVTLSSRLRSMATERCREVGANPTWISCSNFHTFCTRIVQDAELAGLELTAPRGASWTTGIVAKTEQAFQHGHARRFDAVLVDEAHDFTLAWWNLLREHVLAPGGEMLAVADPTQDIYDRFEWMLDDALVPAGFPDEWIDLDESHRPPADLLTMTNAFATEFVAGTTLQGRAPTPDPSGEATRGTDGTVRRWTDVERLPELGRAVGDEVVRLLRETPTLAPADISFVCDYHHDGVAAARIIEAAGIPVHHIFSRDPDAPRRSRRHRFWLGDAAVKGCTAHSLKGWETPALVMGIGVDERARRLAYVAMTRVSVRPEGGPSFVSVVNADAELRSFGERFVAGSPPVPAAPARTAPAPILVPTPPGQPIPPAPRPSTAPPPPRPPAMSEPQFAAHSAAVAPPPVVVPCRLPPPPVAPTPVRPAG